jgi:hypothetical protein
LLDEDYDRHPKSVDDGERRGTREDNDHQPDQYRHRQVDLCDLEAPDRLKRCRQPVTESNADNDAQRHPKRQIALEHAERRPVPSPLR